MTIQLSTPPCSWKSKPVTTATGYTLTAPETIRPATTSITNCQPGHVLVQTAYVGLCGTDRELFNGTHPYLRQGVSGYPLTPGHEWSGTIRAVGPDVTALRPGDLITGDPFITCGHCPMCRAQRRNLCLNRSELGVRGNYPGAAAGIFQAPANICVPLPAAVPLRDAVLIEPSVTVLEGLHRTHTTIGDTVAIIGTGTLGLIAVMLAASTGATVHAVGPSAAGRAQAIAAGATTAAAPGQTATDGFTVVLEASGAHDGFMQAVTLAAPGGRLALLGMPPRPHPVDTTAVVAKDLEVHGVLGGVERYKTAVDAVASGIIDTAALIDAVFDVSDAATAYQHLALEGRPKPKILVAFQQSE